MEGFRNGDEEGKVDGQCQLYSSDKLVIEVNMNIHRSIKRLRECILTKSMQ